MIKPFTSSLWDKLQFHLSHRLGIRSRYEFGIISSDPLVIYTHYDETLWEILKAFRGKPLHCLCSCRWSLTVLDQRQIAERLKAWMDESSEHSIIHLAPTEEEADVLREMGMPVVVCSQNCLISEQLFRVQPEAVKSYRAIYDARLSPFKRHELAADVEGLALVTYECHLNEDRHYNRRIFEQLSGSTWLNGPFSDSKRMLEASEVADCLNQAQVGLILSELEGANYASIQYLLCGLPVVTTVNRGGRDAFFHEDYVIWAEDSSQSVADAVSALIARKLDPLSVREKVLNRIREHREVFMRTVEEIIVAQGRREQNFPMWDTFFSNKLLERWSRLELRLIRWWGAKWVVRILRSLREKRPA